MGMVKEDNYCNYCKWRGMKQVAEAKGNVIKVVPSDSELGGVNVYEVPDGFDIRALSSEVLEGYYKGWFQALPDHCVC